MTAKTKKPDIYSAATTARVIARRLRAKGFLMADTSDKYKWTEGFHVHRLGYSKTVSVAYHIPHTLPLSRAEQILKIGKEMQKAREFLEGVGYVFSPNHTTMYVECERD